MCTQLERKYEIICGFGPLDFLHYRFKCFYFQGSITIIFPDKKQAEKEAKHGRKPENDWLIETHKTYFKLGSDDLPNVKYIIGFVPTTVSTAIKIKKDWERESKGKNPDSIHDAKVRRSSVIFPKLGKSSILNGLVEANSILTSV